MENNIQPYIVQPDGWHVKKKNPFEQYGDAMATEQMEFEANNPPLPLTAWHQPGREVEIDIDNSVWQFQHRGSAEWERYKYPNVFKTFEEFAEFAFTNWDCATRQAFEVISDVGGEKPQTCKQCGGTNVFKNEVTGYINKCYSCHNVVAEPKPELSVEESNQSPLTVQEGAEKIGIQGMNNKLYPIANIKSQGGLKRDIIELVLNLAPPDDDCMLSDFLHALQFVLDKHHILSPVEYVSVREVEKALRRALYGYADDYIEMIVTSTLTKLKEDKK